MDVMIVRRIHCGSSWLQSEKTDEFTWKPHRKSICTFYALSPSPRGHTTHPQIQHQDDFIIIRNRRLCIWLTNCLIDLREVLCVWKPTQTSYSSLCRKLMLHASFNHTSGYSTHTHTLAYVPPTVVLPSPISLKPLWKQYNWVRPFVSAIHQWHKVYTKALRKQCGINIYTNTHIVYLRHFSFAIGTHVKHRHARPIIVFVALMSSLFWGITFAPFYQRYQRS